MHDKQQSEASPATPSPAPISSAVSSTAAAAGQSAELLGPIMRKANGSAGGDPGARYSAATAGGGQAVPYRSEMEASFGGADFSNVQAYTGQAGPMRAIGAEAATAGDEKIAFAAAQPDRETVAHELAHVQQARNVGGGLQASGPVSSPSDPAEREADAAAATIMGGGTVDATQLTARGTGIMRKDVEVTAGDRKETESTDRVVDQGNQFEDGASAWDCLVAWKEGTSITYNTGANSTFTQVPTDAHAARFFYQMTPPQRSEVFHATKGILRHMFARFDAQQMKRVMDYCQFSLQWKVHHWTQDITGGAITRDVFRTMISAAPLGQRLEVVQNEDSVKQMIASLKDDHPENLFGDAVKTQLYPDEPTALVFDAAHPEYAKWRNGAAKLDAEGRLALIAADPVANIAALKTQPVSTLNKWTSLIKWGPRGTALTATQRTSIDTAALTAGVSAADRATLFEMRFNCPLVDPGIALARFKPLYEALQAMPLGIVTDDLVTQITLNNTRAGGAYTDYPHSARFGNFWVGTGPTASLAKIASTTRHEVGHAADVKLGGFTNLASKPPILWKKWMTTDAWVQEMVGYMDGPSAADEAGALTGLVKAALSNTPYVSPFGAVPAAPATPVIGPPTPAQHKQKVWGDATTAYNTANDITKALDVLRPANKVKAPNAAMTDIVTNARGSGGKGTNPSSEPAYLRDRFFLKKYGEHFMYHKKGGSEVWGNANLRAYTLCSPYEFYADIFSAYFSTDANRENNIPAWTRTYMKSLESMYETSAMDDPKNDRALALRATKAPGE